MSPAWFDIAREYTEKWHHQQQIRDATGEPPLYDSELLDPVLETFARGPPFAFRGLQPSPGTRILIQTTGLSSCAWNLVRESDVWSVLRGPEPDGHTSLSIPAEIAWRVWTRSMSPVDAAEQVEVRGDGRARDLIVSFVAILPRQHSPTPLALASTVNRRCLPLPEGNSRQIQVGQRSAKRTWSVVTSRSLM